MAVAGRESTGGEPLPSATDCRRHSQRGSAWSGVTEFPLDKISHVCDSRPVPCNIFYYRSASGSAPVLEFVDALPGVKERAALLADISLLGDEGPVLPFPWTSALRAHEGLRELRSRFGSAQYRVVYLVRRGDVVLLHAFKKTSSAQLQREYRLAAERSRRM